MPSSRIELAEVGGQISPSTSRIIKLTTLRLYQEVVWRTTEGTVSCAFPAFQRSNLAIFRGDAPSRKIGVRAANQRCFMQPLRLKEILSNISSDSRTYELRQVGRQLTLAINTVHSMILGPLYSCTLKSKILLALFYRFRETNE